MRGKIHAHGFFDVFATIADGFLDAHTIPRYQTSARLVALGTLETSPQSSLKPCISAADPCLSLSSSEVDLLVVLFPSQLLSHHLHTRHKP
jgi:hypothetical protein